MGHDDKFNLKGTRFGLLMGLGMAATVAIGYLTDHILFGFAFAPIGGMLTGIVVGSLVRKQS